MLGVVQIKSKIVFASFEYAEGLDCVFMVPWRHVKVNSFRPKS